MIVFEKINLLIGKLIESLRGINQFIIPLLTLLLILEIFLGINIFNIIHNSLELLKKIGLEDKSIWKYATGAVLTYYLVLKK